MRCPSCSARLVELERSEVLIDACPECRGVWLDRGELDRILERERRVAAGVQDEDEDFFAEMEGRGDRDGRRSRERERDRDEDDEDAGEGRGRFGRRRKGRRRGMLEDLFDFEL